MLIRRLLLLSGGAFCVILVAAYWTPTWADDESLLDANVTVTSTAEQSYGASIVASLHTFLPWRALGKPDSRAAWVCKRGRISIELEDTVTDCSSVSIWAARRGWGPLRFSVYVSPDGDNWICAGSARCVSGGYKRYDFSGDFAEVKYVRVKHGGSWWSAILLDAVKAAT